MLCLFSHIGFEDGNNKRPQRGRGGGAGRERGVTAYVQEMDIQLPKKNNQVPKNADRRDRGDDTGVAAAGTGTAGQIVDATRR